MTGPANEALVSCDVICHSATGKQQYHKEHGNRMCGHVPTLGPAETDRQTDRRGEGGLINTYWKSAVVNLVNLSKIDESKA